MNASNLQIVDNGDAAITLIFSEAISAHLTQRIIQIGQAIKTQFGHLVIETIPAYQSLTICFEPLQISSPTIKKAVQIIVQQPLAEINKTPKLIKIPVCYHADFAPDLGYVAHHCGMSADEVIERHSQPVYLIHMLGFLPGFLYLGGLDQQLNCPRKPTPAVYIEAGSVGIGGSQTGVYPVTSPGGWQIIGRTPLSLFKAESERPFIGAPLDRVQFSAISREQYAQMTERKP